MARVGEPKREFVVEPLELPEPLRETPAFDPAEQPVEEPTDVA